MLVVLNNLSTQGRICEGGHSGGMLVSQRATYAASKPLDTVPNSLEKTPLHLFL